MFLLLYINLICLFYYKNKQIFKKEKEMKAAVKLLCAQAFLLLPGVKLPCLKLLQG